MIVDAEEDPMTAFNIVHMRVKPGHSEDFIDLHKEMDTAGMAGMRTFTIVKTGERDFCIVGEWTAMEDLVRARPAMTASLDRLRPHLEDLGGGRGVTEPWSGEVALSLKTSAPSENAL
jgi:hypothetical protein